MMLTHDNWPASARESLHDEVSLVTVGQASVNACPGSYSKQAILLFSYSTKNEKLIIHVYVIIVITE